ncbi:MAG: hypothetical protein IPJ77_08895 [Planctomycetes bacterium]|nr:hypothetical protein [Planctomycetota bacterium]
MPRSQNSLRAAARALTIGLALSVPARAGVIGLGATGQYGYATLEQALSAAHEGDTLCLESGTYAGFVVDGRDLRIVELPGATVVVQGTVTIRNLARGQTVVLDGLDVRAPDFLNPGVGALVVSNCAGCVRFQHSTFTGGEGREYVDDFSCGPVRGGHAAEITNSPRVAFTRCTLLGGWGSVPDDSFDCYGGAGGEGLVATNSTVVLYDSSVTGGHGGADVFRNGHFYQADYPGPGGHGAVLASSRMFASASTLRGGNGASGYQGSRGGDGLVRGAGSLTRTRGVTLLGGAGGPGFPPGTAGATSSGPGTLQTLAGVGRSVELAALTRDAANLVVSVSGVAGDQFFLDGGERAALHFGAGNVGAWLVGAPYPTPASPVPVFVLPSTGTFAVQVPIPDLSAPTFGVETFLQASVLDASGVWMDASPLWHLTVDRDAAPDCNGNGRLDLFDQIEGVALDADGNGLIDACQSVGTWHVDPAAAPGGDGSAARPFPTIHEALRTALPGSTVLLADGLYTGALNLDLALNRIALRSLNGSANCVLDGGDVRRAFRTAGTFESTIDGLTFQHCSSSSGGGALSHGSGSLRVRDSRLRFCRSAQAGGAIGVEGSASLVCEGTEFEDCVVESFNHLGGAIGSVTTGPAIVVRDCTFARNQASFGGAIGANRPFVVQRSRFFRNTAVFGGALYAYRSNGASAGPWSVEECLVAGNFASIGGGGLACDGYGTFRPDVRVLDSTVTGNLTAATGSGGGIWARTSALTLANTIAWGNASGAGAQVALDSGFPSATTASSFVVSYTDLQGGIAGVSNTGGFSTVTVGSGLFDLDPQFADPDGPDNLPLTLFDNDYRLVSTSPCVDAGSNLLVLADTFDVDGDGNLLEALPLDLDDRARFRDEPLAADTGAGSAPIVDLGPYEL